MRTPASRPSGRADLAALAALALLGAGPLLPAWLRGLSPFWGDLTYFQHPWRAFDAQVVQAGRLPLWNPYLHYGMPQAASMQDALLAPGSLPFFLFSFPTGLALFQLAHSALAGGLTFLWLRSLKAPRGAALLGAVLLELGGVMTSRLSYPNHLAVLSLLPGLLLFFRAPRLLALTLAAAFLSGYPQFLIGGALGAWVLRLTLARRGAAASLAKESLSPWAAAAALSIALSAALLIPAAELTRLSRRALGLPLEEVLSYSFALKDLWQWTSPLLLPWSRFDPAADWWKCCYLGFVGIGAAAAGVRRLGRARGLALVAAGAALVVLLLGETNPVSRAAWSSLPHFSLLRYPANLAFLALPALSLLAALGAGARGARLALLAAAELILYGSLSIPTAPRALFATPGPLARRLHAELEGERYLLSPAALLRHGGMGVWDWRARLYGLSNAPSRLAAAGSHGEPLVPRDSHELMDRVYRLRSASEAAAYLPWLGIRVLLTAEPLRSPPPGLVHAGRLVWEVYRSAGKVSRAYLLPAGRHPPPAERPGPLPPGSVPLAWRQPREDALVVSGAGAGLVFASHPRWQGWRLFLENEKGTVEVESRPAFLAFQAVEVPPGPWTLRWRYEPLSWRAGIALSVLSLAALGAWALRRLGALT